MVTSKSLNTVSCTVVCQYHAVGYIEKCYIANKMKDFCCGEDSRPKR